MITWKYLLEEELELRNESWDSIEDKTVSDSELNVSHEKFFEFTIWTKNHVYVSMADDLCEYIYCVARNPPNVS